jgi:branched-chain amino acid transport system permease protein
MEGDGKGAIGGAVNIGVSSLVATQGAAAGAQLFGMVGGAVGSFIPVVGTAAGVMVGGAIGSVTGGFDGFAVPTPTIFGVGLDGATGIYYVSLVVLIFVLWITANILRSPMGRAMVAIRDSEVSAQSMGIHLARYKAIAFAISAGMTGLAGALFAHYVRFLAPDAFDVLLSVQFVTIVFVGGLGSVQGAIFGALFVRLLPQFIAIVRDDLPFGIGRMPGLEPSLFGLVLVLVILFQPGGINGIWQKTKHWFTAFPFKRQTSSRRQKSYAKSERLR